MVKVLFEYSLLRFDYEKNCLNILVKLRPAWEIGRAKVKRV
jgi:hypothetical protein